jgi:hypothetical protein
MKPIILVTCTLLLRLVVMSNGFTTVSHFHHQLLQRQQSHSRLFCGKTDRRLAGFSNRKYQSNEIRIRQKFHELYAVNVEQENDTQQSIRTTSITSGNFKSFDGDNNIYELLGIEEGKLALGVKPEEVYKYIGTYVAEVFRVANVFQLTFFSSISYFLCSFFSISVYNHIRREKLISKTLTDLPTLNREVAEAEVDKFLMDCEMVNMYIQYGKEVEKDPNFSVPDNDTDDNNGWFTPRNIVAGYLTYVGVTSGPQIIRRYIAEQEVKGEWQSTNIKFIDQWIENTSADATARVLQKAAEKAAKIATTTAAESTATTTTITATPSVDVASTDVLLLTPDVVTDSLQSLVDTVTVASP